MSTIPPAYGQQQPPQYSSHQPATQAPGHAPSNTYVQAKPLPTKTTVAETNTYALIAIILAFMVPIAGVIFGHLGLSQIKRNGDAGRGLALTALIYGYSLVALGAIFIILYVGFFIVMFGAIASSF